MPFPNDPAYADGSMAFGSQAVVIGGAGYNLKNIRVKKPKRIVVMPGTNGAPTKKIHIPGLVEGTATAQLGTSTQVAPGQNAVFSLFRVGGTNGDDYIVQDVDDIYEIDGETLCEFTFSQVLNP